MAFIPRGACKPDPDLAVHCTGCGWRSTVRHAKAEMRDVVRCPECNRPVIVDTPESLPRQNNDTPPL